MRSALRLAGAAIAREIGREELVLCAGLALVAGGFWLVWTPGALLAPGAVLVWLSLPPRRPFVARPVDAPRKAA